jgi:hypothetical protein
VDGAGNMSAIQVTFNGSPPNSTTRIIGPYGSNFAVKIFRATGNAPEGQIWLGGSNTTDANVISITPQSYTYEVFISNRVMIGGSMQDAIGIVSGAFLTLNTDGSLNNATGEFIIGLGGSVLPTFFGYMTDGSNNVIPVVASDRHGYFEVREEEVNGQLLQGLLFPSPLTTDVSSYSANRISAYNITGVYVLGDGNVYLTTAGNGLWQRDPVTFRWRGI